MRRQVSESDYQPIIPSTRSAYRSIERIEAKINKKSVIPKVINNKDISVPSQNKVRQVKSKSPGRELNPLQFLVQKNELGLVALTKDKSYNPERIMTSVSIVSEQHSVDYNRKKPVTGSMERQDDNSKMKRNVPYKQSLNLRKITSKNGSSKSIPQKNDNPPSSDKSKTEVTVAIYEQNEDDEEEDRNRKNQPNQNALTEDRYINPTDQSGTYNLYGFHQNNQETMKSEIDPDSPTSKQDTSFGRGRYKFRPGNIVTTDMNSSRLGPGESNANSAKSPNQVRGAFMNEHITQNEFEKQKEKQRQMKEALDFQLNEKKRKQEEEKQRQNDYNKKEEDRIRREMEQLKSQHEKESANENLRKRSHKTEENEKLPSRQSDYKTGVSKQTEKMEKSDKLDKPEKFNTEGNKNESREALGFRIPQSPVKVQRGTSPQGKETSTEKRNRESEPKANSHMDLLLEENNKLRDENTKKEELIDVLLNVLKQKGSTPVHQHHPSRSALPVTKTKEDAEVTTSKPNKRINISNTEADFYGYYLNGYAKPKGKYRASSEHLSEVHKFDAKDTSISIHEDKNFSLNTYEQNENKDFKQKSNQKIIKEYMLENSRPILPVSPTYKSFAVRNYDLPTFFGATPNNRVYSSPLTTHLSKSVLTSPVHKTDNKNGAYMFDTASIYNETSTTPVILEPLKSPSNSNLNAFRNNVLSPNQPINSNNENSIVRLKKRYEHSMDMTETNKDYKLEMNPSKSYRPVINIIREDGSFSLLKNGQTKKKELQNIIHPLSTTPNGMYDYKTTENQEASKYSLFDKIMPRVASFSSNSSNMEPNQETSSYINNQLKLISKLNSYGNGPEKKVSGDFVKDTKWSISEVSSPKRTQKEEELLEKVKILPALGGKSKFPKEVFSLSLRKRANP